MSKKVLVVSGIVFPELGGVSNYVDFLTRRLNDVSVLSFNFYDVEKSSVKIINGKKYFLLRKVYFKSTKISFPLRILLLAYFVRKFSKNAVVYAQDVGVSGLGCYISGKRYFLRFVGDWAYESYYTKRIFALPYKEFLNSSKGLIKKFLSQRVLRNAIKIVTPAQHLKDVLIDYYKVPAHRIYLIYNFTSYTSISAPAKKSNNLLYVGRIAAIKRLDLCIKLFLKLKSLYPDLTLVIIGSGVLENLFRDKVKKLGIEGVIFKKPMKKKDLLKEIASSKCVVMSSVHEGIPFTVIESLSIGVPVISYANPGVEELSKHLEGILIYKDLEEGVRCYSKVNKITIERSSIEKVKRKFSEEKHFNDLMKRVLN